MSTVAEALRPVVTEFAKNPADWLTFGSTLILGAVTAYFAWRTRQLERKQVLQLHREVDLEITDAESEIERARTFIYLWFENWRPNASPLQALETYSRARTNYTRPDLVKTVRILSFYMPGEEDRVGKAIIQLHAVLQALDFALTARPTTSDRELTQHVERAEQVMTEAKKDLDACRSRIAKYKSELRKT